MENGHKGSDEALIDLQRFPVLVEETGRVATPSGAAAGAGGSLGVLVTKTLRDVLGWKTKSGDPRGFQAALTRAFTGREIEGHVEWTWNARTYAVQADLGEITGAQASIYSRAKNALDQSLPLLDGLYSLDSDADAEDQDAIRGLIRAELTELVNELGTTGGPRVQRVDKIFALLVNDDPDATIRRHHSLEEIGGHLRLLGERFHIDPENVNTIPEETNLTNFLILVEHVLSLLRSWRDNRRAFLRTGKNNFIGTQFVLISRDLAVLAESVQAAYAAMDSVYLGAAERETTLLRLCIPEAGETCDQCDQSESSQRRREIISIADLLRWVESYATEEGPRTLQDGGKDGVELAFRPTLRRLQQLVVAARKLADCPSDNPAPGFHSARVRVALQEVELGISNALRNSNGIRRVVNPSIISVIPVFDPSFPETVRLVATGEHFQADATVTIDNVADGILPVAVTATKITATEVRVSVPRTELDRLLGTEAEGTLTFIVEHTEIGGSASRNFGWSQATPAEPEPEPEPVPVPPTPTAPKITSFRPSGGSASGEEIDFTVVGSNFANDAAVSLGEGIDIIDWLVSPGGKRITGHLLVREDAQPGQRAVIVLNPGGEQISKEDVFDVLADVD